MTGAVALRLGRVSNLPTVTSNVLAAIALSGSTADGVSIAITCIAMSLMYVAGMFLNDAFDRTIDAIERPDRPIPSGQVTALEVTGVGFGLLLGGVVMITVLALATDAGWQPIVSVLALAALIVIYDLHHKRNRFGPLLMGLCRVGVYTTAALVTAGSLSTDLLVGALALLAYLIGLTYVARQENLRSVGNLWPLGFLAVPFVVGFPHTLAAAAVFLVFLTWVIRSIKMVIRREIRFAVTSLIAGISLLDALFIIGVERPVMALVAIAACTLTTYFQRAIPGT